MSHDRPSQAIERAARAQERQEYIRSVAADLLVAMASSAEMNRDGDDGRYARDVVGLPRDAAVMALQLAKELGL